MIAKLRIYNTRKVMEFDQINEYKNKEKSCLLYIYIYEYSKKSWKTLFFKLRVKKWITRGKQTLSW